MSVAPDPLCCCEYFDVQQQRNHILACCCNCEDLDASCDSLMRGKAIPINRAQGFISTFHDRIRIPWYGGARKISMGVLLPIIILPLSLILASIDIWWTTFIFVILALFVMYLSSKKGALQTNFFLSWSITTTILLIVIFEFIVVPLLEILITENFGVTLLGCTSFCCFYFVKLKANNCVESEELTGRTQFCSICQIVVPEKHFHCSWLNCCIGIHNRFLFFMGVMFAIGTLGFSSNLTLTSVCHPVRFFHTVLVPDDCTGVYDESFDISLSFVSAIYSIIICNILIVYLMYELILISKGLTGQEWYALPALAKLCCICATPSPYSQGVVSNWYRVIVGRKYQKTVCQY